MVGMKKQGYTTILMCVVSSLYLYLNEQCSFGEDSTRKSGKHAEFRARVS